MINLSCTETGNCPGIRTLPDGNYAFTGSLAGGDGTEATVVLPRAVVETAFGAGLACGSYPPAGAPQTGAQNIKSPDNDAGQEAET